MSTGTVLVTAGIYLALLFALAQYTDTRELGGVFGRLAQPWIYALSIAVFCTSWTFYGSVGRSATSGYGFLPIFIGPVLVFVFCQPFLRKLLAVSKAQHITSIADLIAARYGKRQSLAGLVTLIAVTGVVPYIALQLKAVSSTFDILRGAATGENAVPPYAGTEFYVALAMSLFVIVYGTRRVDATEQHRGMVTAVAFESVIKLSAFLIVGAFVTYELNDGFGDILRQAAANPDLSKLIDVGVSVTRADFWSLTFLAALVIFCLPRQFQVIVVENSDPAYLRHAVWIFSLYLLAINIFVLPIALTGLLHPFRFGSNPDNFVLTLPLADGHQWLALIAFIGGLAAATGMIIVETIALSTMVSNDLVLPLVLRGKRFSGENRGSLVDLVKWVRRVSIVVILLLAFGYVHLAGNAYALVSIGLISFAAVAQFAPAIVGGLYWRHGNFSGAFFGLVAGFSLWVYTLLLPSIAESGWIGRDFVNAGAFGIEMLRPYALFGIAGLDQVSHSMLWSLVANVGVYLACGLLFSRNADELDQARAFVDIYRPPSTARYLASDLRWRDVGNLLAIFLGGERAAGQLADYAKQHDRAVDPEGRADIELVDYAEKLVAGAVGSSLARVVIAAAAKERQDAEHMMSLLSSASTQIELQWQRLHEAVHNISQGLSMFDAELKLVVWNRHFLELLDFPESMGAVGTPFADFIRYNARRGEYGAGEIEEQVRQRVFLARRFEAHQLEHKRPDGRVIEISGKPLPHGGFISTYTDITERKRAEAELQESEARFAATFHLSPVPMEIARCDEPFPGTEFNDAWYRTFGRGTEGVGWSGTDYGLWVNPEQRAPFMERVRGEGEVSNYEVQLRHGNGGKLTVLLSGRRVDTGSDPIILLAYFDVTEQRRADQALRDAHAELEQRVIERTRALQESEEHFRDFAESSSDWLWETDADLRYSYLSERAAERLGRATEALIGKALPELATAEDQQRAPEKWAQFLAAINAHRPFRAFDYPVAMPDGALRQVRMNGKPAFSGSGAFLGYRGTGTDITELVQAQNELMGAEKLAALGGLVAGIAHEINTPLGIGITASTFLQERTTQLAKAYAAGSIKRSDMEAYLQAAREATSSLTTNLQRAAGLVQSFKQVAVDQTSEQRRRFRLREYIDEILDSLRPRLKRTSHRVDVDCSGELELDSYPGAFSQILTNLILNSLIHGFEHTAAGRIEIAAARSAKELLLRYSDNGEGMSATQVKRIFEPFFTTRRGQGGSGLGMNIVYNLITQKLHGHIECRSSPGAGVQFLITLPIDEETVNEPPHAA